MFPQGCPCSVGSCHLEEELFPQQGRTESLLLLPVSLFSRAGPIMPGSTGPLLLAALDWPLVTIPHSYMSPEGHNRLQGGLEETLSPSR